MRVYLPRELLVSEAGFSFAVPMASLGNAETAALASLPDGSALPAWLSFDAQALRFRARMVPSDGLPLRVLVQRGRYAMQIELLNSE